MDGGRVVEPAHPMHASPISDTVAEIYQHLLAEIIGGQRAAGAPVRDREVAAELGVSRTPVREAMLLLRHAGVLEVVASRYTRVAVLDATAVAQLTQVWVGLFGLVVEELLTTGREIDVHRLVAAHEHAQLVVDDPSGFADASGRFFDYLVSRSANPHLVRAIGTVAHALGVAIATLPATEGFPLVLQAQEQLIEAVRTRDARLGRATVTALRAVAGDAA